MPRRPNIVFILSDQHNAKVLGHKGHPDVLTPRLDRMAAEGVRFDNAITQNPICTPSRMCWLSGQYCHNHGYYGLSGPNPNGLPTVLGHFRQAGYRTAAIGKIHCPEHWVEDDSDTFREVCGCSIGGNPEYMAFLAERDGLEAHKESVLAMGPSGRGQCLDGFPSRQTYRESEEGWVVSESIRFMEAAVAEGRPFILHASLPKPHQVYSPSQRFWDLYDQESLTLPPNADYDMSLKAPHLRRTAAMFRTGEWTTIEPRTFEAGRLRKLHGYLGCVSQVDHAVGELLDQLAGSGLDENTIVVYSSDHGDYACEHGLMEKAPGICSDAITRIPMIWRAPGRIRSGHVAEEIVETVDLANTLCRLADLEPLETADGKDISHLLQGEPGEVHRVGVTEFAWSKSVRKGPYRYVHYPREMFAEDYPEGFGELYDLEADPWEMNNLFFEAEHAETVREMREELVDWLITTTRPATILPAHRAIGTQSTTRYANTTNHDGKIHPDCVRETRARHYI